MAQITDITHSLRIDDGDQVFLINKKNLSFEFNGNNIAIYDNSFQKVYSYNYIVFGFTSLSEAIDWFFGALRNIDHTQEAIKGLLQNVYDNIIKPNSVTESKIIPTLEKTLLCGLNVIKKQVIIKNNTNTDIFISLSNIMDSNEIKLLGNGYETTLDYAGEIYVRASQPSIKSVNNNDVPITGEIYVAELY